MYKFEKKIYISIRIEIQLLPFFIFRALISTLLCTCQTRTTSAVQPKFQTAAKSVVCIWLSTQFFQKLSHSMLQNMIKNAKKPWFWHMDRPLSQPFWYKDYRFFFPVKQASPRKLLCYIQRWRWPFWAGSLVMFLLHHR